MSTVVEIASPTDVFYSSAARPLWKDCLLEYLGTLTFVYISLAGVSQVVQSGSTDQFHIALCFALGLTSGIFVAGQSGGHLNPAVSLTLFASDESFSPTRLFGYILSQVCGGFTAGLLVLAVYYGWINNNPDIVSVGTFGTFKNPGNSLAGSIVDQFVGSALLMFAIVRVPSSDYKPIAIGSVLGGLGLFQGSNGFAFNLARDFGPRLASSIVFGELAFSNEDHWFWVPAVVPFIGVPFGYWMAMLMKRID